MSYQLSEIARTDLPATPMVKQGSFGDTPLGAYASTMTLYCEIQNGERSYHIEWDIPDLDETEHIGLELESMRVVGYDGVMSFPRPAYKFLRDLGYTIADDVI